MNLVDFDGNEVYLNTQMTPDVFAKTRFAEKIHEKGVLAELKNGRWNYEPWSFTDTLEKDGYIYLHGTAFSGTTADRILSSACEEKINETEKAICGALEGGLKIKAPLSNIGCGGMILSDDLNSILFLPYNFFTTASMSAGDEEFSLMNGIYINQNGNRETAIAFTQSVLVYRTLAGTFPFEEKNTKQRLLDIADSNYKVLRWTVANAPKRLCDFTERAFAGKYVSYPKEEFESYKKVQVSQSDLEKFNMKARAYFDRKKNRVTSKRFIRAKQTVILFAAMAVGVVSLITGNLYKTSQEKPTSRSLDSRQTVEMFYAATSNLLVDAARNCSAKSMEGRISVISNAFVTSRTRSMYNTATQTVNPSAWFIQNKTRQNIYGITNFLIDGTEASLLVEGPRKNTKPQAITEEDGLTLKDGDEKSYTVEFQLLDTSGEDFLGVVYHKEKVTLLYAKDRWIISSIETVQVEPQEFKFSEFTADYENVMKKNSTEKEDVLFACRALAEKYNFIPTEHEIDEGYLYLKRVSVFNFED